MGYRKNKKDPVSPRALKHVQELEKIKKEHPEYRCILIFIIQRSDCSSFQTSNVDPIYQAAVQKAVINGVEVIPIATPWEYDQEQPSTVFCYFDKVLPRNEISIESEIMEQSFDGLALDKKRKAARPPPKKEDKFINKKLKSISSDSESETEPIRIFKKTKKKIKVENHDKPVSIQKKSVRNKIVKKKAIKTAIEVKKEDVVVNKSSRPRRKIANYAI